MQERRIKVNSDIGHDIFVIAEGVNGNIDEALEIRGQQEQVSVLDRRLGRTKRFNFLVGHSIVQSAEMEDTL